MYNAHTHTHGHAHADTHEHILVHTFLHTILTYCLSADRYLKCWSHIVFLTYTNMQGEGDGDGMEYGLRKYNACSGRLQNVSVQQKYSLFLC